MDRARRIDTGEVIDAEDLWEIQNPRLIAFECPDCGVKLIPAACDGVREEWQYRPYFARPKQTPHKPGCQAVGGDRLVPALSTSERERGFSAPDKPYTRLVTPPENPRVDSNSRGLEGRSSGPEFSQSQALGERSGRHERTANHVRRLCRQYVDFPSEADRRTRLHLPGVGKTTYEKAFRPLATAFRGTDPGRRIFFGEIRFKSLLEVDPTGRSLIISFQDGLWENASGWKVDNEREVTGHGQRNDRVQKKAVRLRIDTTGWHEGSVRAVHEELLATQKEARSRFRRNLDGEKIERTPDEIQRQKAYVFFFGRRDQHDTFLFHVENRRWVCGFLAYIDPRAPKRSAGVRKSRGGPPTLAAAPVTPDNRITQVSREDCNGVSTGAIANIPRTPGCDYQMSSPSAEVSTQQTGDPPIFNPSPDDSLSPLLSATVSAPTIAKEEAPRTILRKKKGILGRLWAWISS